MEECDLCQRIKNRIEKLAEKLKLSKISEKPWTHIMVVAKKDAILVVCNRLSKMTYFMAATEGTLAEGLARLCRNNMWKLHGLPESVVSDRGLQFAVELMKELNKMLKIEMKLLTAFHPQTNEQTE